jgi:RNA polymerase sigma-70 factor (ECF subfamily)
LCSLARVSLGERFPDVLAAAAAGDRDAFAELWRSMHPMLLRYLRVVCGGAAEDVASDVWVKVVGSLGSFRGDENGFCGWLVVIARNLARDGQRRDRRRREIHTDASFEDAGGTTPDAADLAIENRATRAALHLVATLPADQAELVMLRVVVGMDVADVARITGRSAGAVRVAVHRALRTLAGRLAEGMASDPLASAGEPMRSRAGAREGSSPQRSEGTLSGGVTRSESGALGGRDV